MSARLLFSSMVVVMGLQGCAQLSPREPRQASKECDVGAGKCKLDIEVLDCTKPDGFKVSNPNLVVTTPSTIEWTIQTKDYRFRKDINGIVIADKDGVFDTPKLHGEQKFSWRDKHREAGKSFRQGMPYYYFINIEREDGKPCVPFDPWISNY